MIYISEARLTRAARHLTRDPYAMHRTLTFALRRKPVMCRPDQLTPLEES